MRKAIAILSILTIIFTFGCASKFENLKKAADRGDPVKQHQVAYSYWNGYGVKKNEEMAVKYYKLSADQGYPKAKYSLALVYLKKKQKEKALKLIEESAKAGYKHAQGHLGSLYMYGNLVKKDQEKGLFWLNKSYEQKSTASAFDLAVYYKDKKQYTEARKYLEEIAFSGPDDVTERLRIISFIILADTEYDLNNKVKAFAWYNVATVCDAFVIKPKMVFLIKKFEALRDELSEEDLNKATFLSLELHHNAFVKKKHYFVRKDYSKYLYKNTYFIQGGDSIGFLVYFQTMNRETYGAVRYLSNKMDPKSRLNYSYYARKLAVKEMEYGSIRPQYYGAWKYLEESYNIIKDLKDKKYDFAKLVTLAQMKTAKSLADAQEKVWISWKKDHNIK